MTHISTRQLHPLPLSLTLYLLMLACSLLRNRLKKESEGKKSRGTRAGRLHSKNALMKGSVRDPRVPQLNEYRKCFCDLQLH